MAGEAPPVLSDGAPAPQPHLQVLATESHTEETPGAPHAPARPKEKEMGAGGTVFSAEGATVPEAKSPAKCAGARATVSFHRPQSRRAASLGCHPSHAPACTLRSATSPGSWCADSNANPDPAGAKLNTAGGASGDSQGGEGTAAHGSAHACLNGAAVTRPLRTGALEDSQANLVRAS